MKHGDYSLSDGGWIGVDLDGTLARYDGWAGPLEIGAPIALMVERVQRWLRDGYEVRIFTARAYPGAYTVEQHREAIEAIELWCLEHIGMRLLVTCQKDYGMIELWDDRVVQVTPNTGEPVGTNTRGLS